MKIMRCCLQRFGRASVVIRHFVKALKEAALVCLIKYQIQISLHQSFILRHLSQVTMKTKNKRSSIQIRKKGISIGLGY